MCEGENFQIINKLIGRWTDLGGKVDDRSSWFRVNFYEKESSKSGLMDYDVTGWFLRIAFIK